MTRISFEVDLEKLPNQKKDWDNWVKEKIRTFVKDESKIEIQNTTEKGTKIIFKMVENSGSHNRTDNS